MHSFSKLMLKFRQIETKVHHYFHIFPFYWDPSKKLYIKSKDYWDPFICECIYAPLYSLYLSFHFIKLTFSGSLNEIGFLSLNCLLTLLVAAQYYMCIWHLDEFVEFMNAMIYFGSFVSSKFIFLVSTTKFLNLTKRLK